MARPGFAPAPRLAGQRLGPGGLADHRPVGADIGDLDAQHEAHRVQPRRQRRGVAGLGGDPGALAVVDEVQDVLDVALGAQDEGLAGLMRAQAGEVLAGDRVQPGQPVRTGHGHHAAVGEVHHCEPFLEEPLLAHRVAVVGRHARVGALPLDRAGMGQQGRAQAGRGVGRGAGWGLRRGLGGGLG